MSNISSNDRAIKKSAEAEPPYTPRPSAPRLEGPEKDALVENVVRGMKVPETYTHVHVINYPAFNESWDHMLVNFYFEQESDPKTYIKSFRAYTSGDIKEA